MLSAVIATEHGYPALRLAAQLVHRRFVHPGPFVLWTAPLKSPSRHRGAKQSRRCELLETISLLSPAYLLSVERWPFHTGPPDH